MTLDAAVIGAGPAGYYSADELTRLGCRVDVFEALPVPFGLLRYGVAPDHFKIKSTAAAFEKIAQRPDVRFFGNVRVGRDLHVRDLLTAYNAVVLAVGCPSERHLGIEGESLPGSISAADFVAWYNAHPGWANYEPPEDLSSTVVVGAGNVALDVVRILSLDPDRLRPTDCPKHVLDGLARRRPSTIHLVCRRGPHETRFTSKELAELGKIDGLRILVHYPGSLIPELTIQDPNTNRILRTLEEWRDRDTPMSPAVTLHIHFGKRPAAILGSGGVEGVALEVTAVAEDGTIQGTGDLERIRATCVIRAVGYRGAAVPGVPFDDASRTIPNLAGRVQGDYGQIPGLYAAGWCKRGPSGVIGTNRADARETTSALVDDLQAQPRTLTAAKATVLQRAQLQLVDWAGWNRIEAAEEALGTSLGRGLVKIHTYEGLLRAAAPSLVLSSVETKEAK